MLQELVSGLSVGVVYGLVGVGFVIIHRITGMVNFAQGELAMLGGFGAVLATEYLPAALGPIAGALIGAIAGLLLYVLVVHPLRNKGLLIQTIATLGAGVVLRSAAQLAFGTQPHTVPPITEGDAYAVGGVFVPRQVVWLLALGVLVYVVLTWFFGRTMVGRAMSACAINRFAASLIGVEVALMSAAAFVLSGAVTGAVGAAAAPLTFATAGAGLGLALKGFIAAILGGFDSIGLALVGGLLVGIVEAYAAGLISTSYQGVIVLGLLLALLVVRPTGLTRHRVADRV